MRSSVPQAACVEICRLLHTAPLDVEDVKVIRSIKDEGVQPDCARSRVVLARQEPGNVAITARLSGRHRFWDHPHAARHERWRPPRPTGTSTSGRGRWLFN